jgi:glycosyltransferase involved in cell wall biosynthesis
VVYADLLFIYTNKGYSIKYYISILNCLVKDSLKKEKPIVSIGMCVRDGEKLVRNALNSVANQDFQHEQMQIILVDDGSVDHTLQIVNECISTIDIQAKIFHTHWQGVGSARNLIAKYADGFYILWVDADELIPRTYVRKQIEFMERNPKVGIVTGIFNTVPSNLILNLELLPSIVHQSNFGKPRSLIWKTNIMPGTGGAIFRADALNQVKGFNDHLKGVGEDQDVAYRIKEAGWQIRVNTEPFYEFHGGMSTIFDLWKKYFKYGQHSEVLYHHNRALFSLPRMSIFAAFLLGILYSIPAYRLFRQKTIFLLPFHYILKMNAWMMGFIQGQISAGKES